MLMTFSCCLISTFNHVSASPIVAQQLSWHHQLFHVRFIGAKMVSVDSIQRPSLSYKGEKKGGGGAKNQNFHRTNLVLLYNVMYACYYPF